MTKYILLVVLVISAASVVSAQRLRSGPTDLAVRVEIVGRDIYQNSTKKEEVLYAKVLLQNKSGKAREVVIMTCGWTDSWASKGAYGLYGNSICDSNHPTVISIPVGQSLVFYSTLRDSGGNIVGQKGKQIGNQLVV